MCMEATDVSGRMPRLWAIGLNKTIYFNVYLSNPILLSKFANNNRSRYNQNNVLYQAL